ncbi:MAG: hypothetical protein ACYDB7_05525, partial [Mycobacteriales bacterium]
RPGHLLAALAELDGPISDTLRPPHGAPLLSRPTNPAPVHGGGASYLMMQTQQAANQLAAGRNETAGPEHLFLAVLDQAEPEAAALAKPGLVELPPSRHRDSIAMPIPAGQRRRFRRSRRMYFTVGWGTWLANRGVGLRDRWFRLRTMTAYRRAPQP